MVDDASFMRMVVKRVVEKGGHEVVGEASNGVEAVDMYKSISPDVVTMDITMPEKDGISALKDILAFDKNARVLMCSAMGQQNMVIESIKSGAKGFVVKPFEGDKVLDEVNKLI